jgi:hypothetical protein
LIPVDLRQSPTLISFKNKYKKRFFCRSFIGAGLGIRKLDIYHTRYRLGYITLNMDLYLRSIINSPICCCTQEAEVYHHYFMNCPIYHVQRVQLLDEMRRIFNECGIQLDYFSSDLIVKHLMVHQGISRRLLRGTTYHPGH